MGRSSESRIPPLDYVDGQVPVTSKLVRVLVALSVIMAATFGTMFAMTAMAAPAKADGCYTWSGRLQNGSTGTAVRQLQIRIAGYPGYNSNIVIDGVFGNATEAALRRFQSAYGLTVDGIAGQQTFNKLYDLQDNDCTPIHFTYAELNNCNSTWSGGLVSATQARTNALRLMWQLEALRHALGDRRLVVSSGFRSLACNPDSSDGYSRHLYGAAADFTGTPTLCQIVRQARYHGFEEILGPGYPGHSDHAHVANDPTRTWSASQCM
ncbi:D-Ala-D-Ala carboxypeptidase family metallohydrolase [Actinomadura adrarensis]|uniref:D-Ala-D-Ala carboxypeptidase family metallohydrolase n=1 Tax=Actinomadura adrarensis TaxID=1819600 RepID=A0ABW3CAG6_9ACTN